MSGTVPDFVSWSGAHEDAEKSERLDAMAAEIVRTREAISEAIPEVRWAMSVAAATWFGSSEQRAAAALNALTARLSTCDAELRGLLARLERIREDGSGAPVAAPALDNDFEGGASGWGRPTSGGGSW